MNFDRSAEHWTQSSIDCYNRGCNCNGCVLKEILETRCFMKAVVFELVRKFGKPSKKPKRLFTPYEQSVLDAIKEGCNSFEEIAEQLNKSYSAIRGIIHLLYIKARKVGWKPTKKGIIKKSLLPQFIHWVRLECEE